VREGWPTLPWGRVYCQHRDGLLLLLQGVPHIRRCHVVRPPFDEQGGEGDTLDGDVDGRVVLRQERAAAWVQRLLQCRPGCLGNGEVHLRAVPHNAAAAVALLQLPSLLSCELLLLLLSLLQLQVEPLQPDAGRLRSHLPRAEAQRDGGLSRLDCQRFTDIPRLPWRQVSLTAEDEGLAAQHRLTRRSFRQHDGARAGRLSAHGHDPRATALSQANTP
jgi:hypothetical protein